MRVQNNNYGHTSVTHQNSFYTNSTYTTKLTPTYLFWFKCDLDKSTTHPNFDIIGVQTHDLQIMDSVFHVPETLVLITESSKTFQIYIESYQVKLYHIMITPYLKSFLRGCK